MARQSDRRPPQRKARSPETPDPPVVAPYSGLCIRRRHLSIQSDRCSATKLRRIGRRIASDAPGDSVPAKRSEIRTVAFIGCIAPLTVTVCPVQFSPYGRLLVIKRALPTPFCSSTYKARHE